MAVDLADYFQAVNVVGGSVAISGTATVTISGTPTVQFAAGQMVGITGTVTVTISSGTVTIGNASIAVINASGTKITSARPPQDLGAFVTNPNPNTSQVTLPADIQALLVHILHPASGMVHLKIVYHFADSSLTTWVPLELYEFTQQIYVIPLTPPTVTRAQSGNLADTISLTIQGTDTSQAVQLIALFEANPLWLEYYQPPFVGPNQPPLQVDINNLASATAAWLINPVANLQLDIFEIVPSYITGNALQYVIGHGTTLPLASPSSNRLLVSGNSGAFLYEYHGAQLPRGDGIWVWNNSVNVLTLISVLFTYSLA